MRRAILAVIAALFSAPVSAATLSRIPSAPVPILRGSLAAPSFRTGLSPILLAAPLTAPGPTLPAVLPQLQPTPAVQVQTPEAIPEIYITPALPGAFSLEHLVSFAATLSRLATDDPKPALDAFWNGPQARSAVAAVEAETPSGLATPRDADLQRLGGIVAASRAAPTGRKIVDAALALAKKEGKPIQVRFHDLKGNLGEYDYMSRVLYLDRRYADGDTNLAAATLVHELLHILQHAEGVPSEALEMELEAHVVTLKVLAELGVPAKRDGSFSAAAERELRKSPQAFEEWMAGQLSSKLRLNKGFAAAMEDLEAERDEIEEDVENLEEAYAEHATAQAKGRLAKARERLDAVLADIKVLKSPSGRAAYRKLAARVRILMQRYHRDLVRRRQS
ncbi:MAG: hypothetical protein NTY77_11830 [Elusimicrobia bacterium]|nr:hypothetical protein [Elusimicrobiota bacterium]